MPIVNRRLAKLRNKTLLAGAIAFIACTIIGIVLEVIGGIPVVFILIMAMPVSAFGVGLLIRRQIDTKRRTRAGNIGLAVTVIIIMEIFFIGGTVFAIMNIPFTLNSDSLGNRPALTLNDVGVTSEPNHSTTSVKGTIAVPVDYVYWESGSGGTVNTQVYRSVNKTLSRWLYEHLAEEFTEQFTRRLDDMNYLQESIVVLSPNEAAIWGAEKGIAFNYANSNAVEVLLWNDKTILRLSAESMNMDVDTVNQAVLNLWGG